ncbi:pilus assembly protein PilP [Candidatus Pelagibacter sp.]|nr:pilus assembly protein PilP [Candidatus Pelagibacter sp.]
MNFFKTIIILIIFALSLQNSYADNHDQKNIVDKAKEISKAAADAQAKALENIKDEVGDEEVPLNDPFAGNAAASSSGTISFDDSSEEEKKLSLNNFKLVGIISGKFESYVSLADSSGKVITIQLNEELEEGLKFVDLRLTEAIFEKEGGKYVVIDFKNRVKEVDEY